MQPKVLIVDDDHSIRRVLARVLRGPYVILEADRAAVALEMLAAERDVAVIYSDVMMPGMNGVEFLRASIALAPHAVRILSSAQAELREFLDVVDECELYTFVAKPFDHDAVRIVVRRAVEHYLLSAKQVKLVDELERQVAREGALRRAFQRYVPSEVVEELTNSNAPPSLIGRKREVTVLFADLRGFTAFSEKRDPANVVALLNRFFDAMAGPVIACGGTIDKYIGDAVLAHFGGVRVDALAAEHAVRAALGMRASLVTLNRQLAEDGVPAFRFGVAINTGSCIVGNVGCSARMDYTVIGDAVNVAARVEGLTKGKDNCILITGATRALVSSRFVLERWPPTTVRGRQEEIDVYEVMAAQPDT